LLKHLQDELQPIRDRRDDLAKRPDDVRDMIKAGNEKARREARKTMDKVRKSYKIDYNL